MTAMPESTPSVAPERMQCMEIWGGNRGIQKQFRAPGLGIHVYSQPYLNSQSGGGDIYYLTSCASGRISRFLLADVSGHGKEASHLAVALRDLMRNHVNKISQEKFVKQLNREFGKTAKSQGFATAVVATFFAPSKKLTINLAGHPYPMYYSKQDRRWSILNAKSTGPSLENLPLGIDDSTAYPKFEITTALGDMFLLYSDALVESIDSNGKQIGIAGLQELLNQAGEMESEKVIPCIQNTLKSKSESNLDDDDTTMILGQFTQSKVNWGSNLMAPFRLFGGVKDRTSIG